MQPLVSSSWFHRATGARQGGPTDSLLPGPDPLESTEEFLTDHLTDKFWRLNFETTLPDWVSVELLLQVQQVHMHSLLGARHDPSLSSTSEEPGIYVC